MNAIDFNYLWTQFKRRMKILLFSLRKNRNTDAYLYTTMFWILENSTTNFL